MGSERDLSELHDDLRSTSEDIAADAAQLQRIEAKKTALPLGDPRLLQLAKEAVDLGEQLAAKTSVELSLVEDVPAAR